MNLTQISGACSLICQKWAWRWFYSTTEINSPPFLWLMQPTWRKIMKAWSYCWERLSMTNLHGSYVVISSWGTVTRNAIRLHKILLFQCEWDSRDKENHYVNKLWPKWTSLTPGKKNVAIPRLILLEKIYLPPLHINLGLMKNSVDSSMWRISSQMWVTQKQGGYIYRTPDQGTDARQTVWWRPEWDWKKCMVVI